MIITRAMVESLGGCDSGLDFMRSYAPMFPNGIDYNQAVGIVEKLGMKDLVVNLRMNKPLYIRMSDKYAKGRFRYFCTKCNEESLFDTQEEAEQLRALKKQEIFDAELPKFTITQEVEHGNGDVTWFPIAFEDLAEEDRYQVFNPTTGVHTLCESLNAVKDFIKNSVAVYVDQHVSVVEQEILSGYGDAAWVSLDNLDPIVVAQE